MPYICLSQESYDEVADYAAAKGLTIGTAASKAIRFFWQEVGFWSVEQEKKQHPNRKRRPRKDVVTLVSVPALVVTEPMAVNQ